MAVFSQWQQAPVFGSRQALPFFHYLSFFSAATSAANGDGPQAMPQQQQPRASMTLTMMLQSVSTVLGDTELSEQKMRERERKGESESLRLVVVFPRALSFCFAL